MGNGSADFANNVMHLTLTNFLQLSLNNREKPFSLLLLVLYNNNEIQEQIQINSLNCVMIWLTYDSFPFYAHVHACSSSYSLLTRNTRRKSIPKQDVLGY